MKETRENQRLSFHDQPTGTEIPAAVSLLSFDGVRSLSPSQPALTVPLFYSDNTDVFIRHGHPMHTVRNPTSASGALEKYRLSEAVKVSVIIPHFYGSRDENLRGLLGDLRKQSFKDLEVVVVPGVSPQGKAINQGVRSAQGEIIVILDDDSRLGHPRVIENLVRVIREDSSIGMVGASVVTSEKVNRFQRMAGKQFPRFHMPVVSEVTESDLPGHPCAAFPTEVFIKVGMEREDILRGLDPDLRVRIRKAGYRVVLAPDTWIYHPLPESLLKFIRVFLRNGYGSAYLQKFYPEIAYDTDEALDSKAFRPKHSFLQRAIRYPSRLLNAFLSFQWIRLLGYLVYLIGYVGGYLRFAFSRRPVSKL